jgi:DNA-binding IclR family transcriptional regulator
MSATAQSREVQEDGRYHVPNLERALHIIEFLDAHCDGRSMSELAQALKFPKNSVFRIVMTLLKHGYLERREDGSRFVLSRKVLGIGYRAVGEGGIVENSIDQMRQLRDVVKETVCLSILLDGEGFVLEQVAGLHPFRFVAEPGTRQPLHVSAAPKAILACLPAAESGKLVGRVKMPRLTPRTIVSKREYCAELARIRARGYALDLGEHQEGVVCVGAAILNRRGYPVAAVTVTGPSSRMPKEALQSIGAEVRKHADAISGRLGRVFAGRSDSHES